LFLWKWNDLPPGAAVPQAAPPLMSHLRDGAVVKVFGCGGQAQNCNTPRQIREASARAAVTGLTIHAIVIRLAIPVADLLQ